MSLELWAKSAVRKSTGKPPTIVEHCREGLGAADPIWGAIEDDLAAATKIPITELQARLRPLFRAAALLHDIGKANSAFQAMLRPGRQGKERQPVRHEILSA